MVHFRKDKKGKHKAYKRPFTKGPLYDKGRPHRWSKSQRVFLQSAVSGLKQARGRIVMPEIVPVYRPQPKVPGRVNVDSRYAEYQRKKDAESDLNSDWYAALPADKKNSLTPAQALQAKAWTAAFEREQSARDEKEYQEYRKLNPQTSTTWQDLKNIGLQVGGTTAALALPFIGAPAAGVATVGGLLGRAAGAGLLSTIPSVSGTISNTSPAPSYTKSDFMKSGLAGRMMY